MSTVAVTDVLDRSMRDDAFLDRFLTQPEETLSDYDLTPEEHDALLTRDDRAVYDAIGDAHLDWQISVVVVVIG